MKKLLVKRFHAVKVFRMRFADIRIYVCVLINGGDIASLVTTAIET